jgi:hypothetical protein
MVSGSESPIRRKISPKEFYGLTMKDECFLLHCTIDVDLPIAQFIPLEKIPIRKKLSGLEVEEMETWLEMINVPYYEIEVKNSIDLLLELGITQSTFWWKGKFNPCMLTIYKGKVVHNTRNTCYCFDSVTESLVSIDLKYINLDKLND